MSSNLKFEFNKPEQKKDLPENSSSVVIKCTYCNTRFSVGYDQIKLNQQNKFKCFCCSEVFIADVAAPHFQESVQESVGEVVPEKQVASKPRPFSAGQGSGNQFTFKQKSIEEPIEEKVMTVGDKSSSTDNDNIEQLECRQETSQQYGFHSGLKIKEQVRLQKKFTPNQGKDSVKNFSPRANSSSFSFDRFAPAFSKENFNVDGLKGKISNFFVNAIYSFKEIAVYPMLVFKNFFVSLKGRVARSGQGRRSDRLFSKAFLWFNFAIVATLVLCFMLAKYSVANPQGLSRGVFGSFANFVIANNPSYPVAGIGVKNLELQDVLMADGAVVSFIKGSFYNNSSEQVNSPLIQTVLFDELGAVSQQQTNMLSDNLAGVLLSNLSSNDIFAVSEQSTSSEQRIQPDTEISFTFPLKNGSIDSSFYTSRVYSVS